MSWTQKEKNFLKDIQNEEKLCAEKYQKAAEALNAYKNAFPEDYLPYAFEGMLYITMENEKPQDQRNYSRGVQAYDTAGQMLRSDDDQTYYQQLGNLIDSLRANGWL